MAIDIAGVHARVDHSLALSHSMPVSGFPTLLTHYMRRIRASAAGIASEIGMSREAVNNWRNGDSLPSRRHRDKVLACAGYLRLSEEETNGLLAAVGFEPEFLIERASTATMVSTATVLTATVSTATASTAAASPAILHVFDRLQQLRPYPILMLLTPAHLGQPPEREAMLAEARRRYGAESVLHVQPPFSLNAGAAAYFSAIAAQCGFAGIESDYAFEAALSRRLQSSGRLFCLVSRFEQGDPVQRDVLAGILRSLSEMHSGRLNLLICGGAALSDLKYQGGDLSLLNIATAETWPELTVEDVDAMAQRRSLAGVDAARALRLAGAHPLLTDAALTLLADDALRSDSDLIELLAAYEPLWQSFLPLIADRSARDALALRLAQQQLVRAQPYLLDPLLRRLYWGNLIVARRYPEGAWLEWRCVAIRRAGALIAAHADATA